MVSSAEAMAQRLEAAQGGGSVQYGDAYEDDEEHRKLIEAIKEKNAKRQAEKDARARHFLDEEVKRLEKERTQLRMAKQELEA